MRPLDPRLLRHARATWVFLAATVLVGFATAALVVVSAGLLAGVLARAFLHGAGTGDLRVPLGLLAATVAGRAALALAQEVAAHRCSAAVKARLRGLLLAHVVRLGPGWTAHRADAEVATLATRGIDALDGYFARYLPRLVLACVVPVAVLARVATLDPWSGAVLAVTLPLVPVFMVLVGLHTAGSVERRWATLSRLAGHFLDVVTGLATLKVFGRARAQAGRIGRVTDDYRRATLSTLRVAFLSSLVLETLSMLSVALVAVSVGVRLVHGEIGLRTALVVFVLAPEAYLPLRALGAEFHASAEGLAAAGRVFDVLGTAPERPASEGTAAEGSAPARSTVDGVPDPARLPLRVRALTVRHPGRSDAAPDAVTLTVPPGRITAVTGPSGCGKSTLLAVLLGFRVPDGGRLLVGDVDLSGVDVRSWRRRVVWVPQRPYLVAGTVGDNVALAASGEVTGDPAGSARVAAALRAVGLSGDALPQGAATPVGEGGTGLSMGQRQRVALARVFVSEAPLVLLDEPTAHLDAETEAVFLAALCEGTRGRTVLAVSHRPAVLAAADTVVRWASTGVPV